MANASIKSDSYQSPDRSNLLPKRWHSDTCSDVSCLASVLFISRGTVREQDTTAKNTFIVKNTILTSRFHSTNYTYNPTLLLLRCWSCRYSPWSSRPSLKVNRKKSMQRSKFALGRAGLLWELSTHRVHFPVPTHISTHVSPRALGRAEPLLCSPCSLLSSVCFLLSLFYVLFLSASF